MLNGLIVLSHAMPNGVPSRACVVLLVGPCRAERHAYTGLTVLNRLIVLGRIMPNSVPSQTVLCRVMPELCHAGGTPRRVMPCLDQANNAVSWAGPTDTAHLGTSTLNVIIPKDLMITVNDYVVLVLR